MNARQAPRGGALALRGAVAALLLVNAGVHVELAPGYQLANPAGVGQGTLFYVEAAAAVLCAAAVLIWGTTPAYLAAVLVSGGALAAVLLSTAVPLPAFGPIPPLYEPVWYFEKTLSAVAEGLALVLALVGLGRELR